MHRVLSALFVVVFVLGLFTPLPAIASPTAATIFAESMFDGTGGANGDSIATHEANSRFANDALTMSGTGDMRTTNTSSGYTGATGTWNVMLNAASEYFEVADTNTVVYANLTLSFGVRKGTTAENGSGLTVAVSSDGTNWTSLTFPALPTGTGTATWYYRTASGTIPATANLRIRFTSTNTVEWRIDDVSLAGDLQEAAPSVSSTTPGNGAVDVSRTTNVNIAFSENVNVTGSWYSISCATSGTHTGTVSGGPTTFTLDPATDFTAGETCTATVYAAQVTDQDSNDPPDNMTADYTWNWTVAASASTCTELFFSEYVEGSSNNKAIEIFNGATTAVNLSGYSVELYTNGSATVNTTLNLSGSVAPGDVYVIANSAAVQAILVVADVTSGVTSFNGDDALILKHNGVVIDVIGQVGFDPGTAWGSGVTSTLDHTLRRKASISAGDTNPSDVFDPAIQWDGFAIDTFDGLGSHAATCGADVAPTVSSTSPANGATAVAVNANVSITFSEAVTVSGTWYEIACTSSGSHTATVSGGLATYTLNPDTDFGGGETCTVTVYAGQVTDQDGAPNQMAANYSFSFVTVGGDACTGPADFIHAIQGSGASSPVSSQSKTIMGYVVGDFQVSGQLNGFFVQEEPADFDADATTSEGIYVYQGSTTVIDLNVGDKVRLTGIVSEFADRTQGGGTITELSSPSNVIVCSTGNSVTPVDVTLPETTDGDLEHYEGMLVRITSTTTVAQTYYLGRYGQMSLSGSGRLWTPTNAYRPGTADAINLANLNARSLLILDDGKAGTRCGDNPSPVPYLGGPPPNVIRAGDTVSNLVGVIDYGQIDSGATGTCSSGTTLFGGDYRLHPTQSPVFTAVNPRPAAPPNTDKLKVVGANLLNFFNGPTFPTSRGAANFTDFVKQRIKLYEELSQLNADVVTLMEVENDGFGAASAIQDLVNTMNQGPCWNSASACSSLGYSSSGMGAGTYAFVNMGSAIGTDEITVGLMYKPANVDLIGTPAILTAAGYTDPNNTGSQRSRPALAASFREKTSEAVYTVVANHLKSKGSCPTSGVDADQGDGQGCWNDTRKKAAAYLVNNWLPTHPTGINDNDFLLMGDMNAYAQEDPVQAFKDAGYTDLISQFVPAGNRPQGTGGGYSYVFDGAFGYLDHALASSSLTPQVKSAAQWHNNADEPTVIDYDSSFNPAGYYTPNAFRASDHDPVLVGLTSSPLAVDLAAFTATANGAGIELAWETASEQDNAGFNVLRGVSQDGPWSALNATLIAAAAPGAPGGHGYRWTDATAGPDVTYWYRLESVDRAGGRQLTDPISARRLRPTAVSLYELRAAAAPGARWPFALLLPAIALLLWRRRG